MNGRVPHVVVSDGEPGLPYSKGLMASRVMVSGLSSFRAYQVAERIEEVLVARGEPSVTPDDLNSIAVRVLEEVAGDRYARNFVRWNEVERLDIPLVVLIGGATGVGKSTIATQLAARLGIVRLVATDAIREVMRSMLSRELMPTLHTSSFDAASALREPVPGTDKVIAGFREQTAAVGVGLTALLQRAAVEQTSVIIEGAHVVPGFIDLEPWHHRVLAVPVVITVEDEEVHRSHFSVRWADAPGRQADRYVQGFPNIRKVQKFIRSQALSHGVPVIPNYSLDQAIASAVDLVVERATSRAGEPAAAQEEVETAAAAESGTVVGIEGRSR